MMIAVFAGLASGGFASAGSVFAVLIRAPPGLRPLQWAGRPRLSSEPYLSRRQPQLLLPARQPDTVRVLQRPPQHALQVRVTIIDDHERLRELLSREEGVVLGRPVVLDSQQRDGRASPRRADQVARILAFRPHLPGDVGARVRHPRPAVADGRVVVVRRLREGRDHPGKGQVRLDCHVASFLSRPDVHPRYRPYTGPTLTAPAPGAVLSGGRRSAGLRCPSAGDCHFFLRSSGGSMTLR